MTETLEQVDVDVDLDMPVPCLFTSSDHPDANCPTPAEWLVVWICGCSQTLCGAHKQELVQWAATATGRSKLMCTVHRMETAIVRTEKL